MSYDFSDPGPHNTVAAAVDDDLVMIRHRGRTSRWLRVADFFAGRGGAPSYRTVSGTTDTPTSADTGLVAYTSSSAVTVTAIDLGAGVSYSVMQQGTGQVTVAAGSGVTLVSDKASGGFQTARRGAVLSVICKGDGTVFVVGNSA